MSQRNLSFSFFASPIRLLVIYLALMAAWATVSWSGEMGFWMASALRWALVYVGMRGTFWVLGLVWDIKDGSKIENRLITSLILYLLFDPLMPLWVFGLAGVVGELVSRVFRSLTGPVLNPAAAGALVLSLFGILPGWWGTSFAPRIYIVPDGISFSVVLTAVLAGYVAYKYKKLLIAVVAGLCYFLLATLLKGSDFSLFAISEGTVLFFLLVMAVEPKTSPAVEREQVIYGLTVGGVAAGLLITPFADPYTGALMVANLATFAMALRRGGNRLLVPRFVKERFGRPA